MRRNLIYWLLALFVLLDLLYSFIQNYQLPLDGDLAAIVLPGSTYQRVLQDPFGWAVLSNNAQYAGPNRYFAHALLSGYFRNVPLWLQIFTDPVTSVYAAAAIAKTLTQALLLYSMALFCCTEEGPISKRLLIAAALLLPLFQGAGYNAQMGIIDHSITYTFFYAVPLMLLLFWLLPFYRTRLRETQGWSIWRVVALGVLAVVLAFNGPVIPGVMAVLGIGIVAYALKQYHSVGLGHRFIAQFGGWRPLLLLLGFGALCLYSLFIGRNNSENMITTPTLWERYKLLPMGIFYQLSGKLGLPLLLAVCLLNDQLIKRLVPVTAENKRLRQFLRYIGWFVLAYVLLLPLGGYRPYRPYLLRRDTSLPIILAFVLFYGMSGYYLLRNLPARQRSWYIGLVVLFGAIFMNADKLHITDNNGCERVAFQQLAHSTSAVVSLPMNCAVMSWETITDPEASALNALLLQHWRIIDQPRRYYHSGSNDDTKETVQ
ncbi:hypothetical protein DNI29_04170 [Hymenobacter sediminis]|uniref:hypothetical protein n=1 Tax=Hymenobacter sediminis TaxID=2218621 RepID=UPI000DA6A891|nr:hypothetical protein [Hymenobacter sediminis]RPD49999.1 hypothetical protein DNI29_04170 [Hymenobacter sediminis]